LFLKATFPTLLCSAMMDLLIVLIHLLTTIAKSRDLVARGLLSLTR
jgi:hypothetical protein